MTLVLYGLLFLISAAALYLAGEWIVSGLTRLSRAFGVREFVLAFFIMAAAASLPNLFVGVTSAIQGIPELSLGDIFGNNFIAITLGVAAAVLFSRAGSVGLHSETVRTSLIFTVIAAALPVLLILDGFLSRIDGVVLIGFFFIYSRWLFSRSGQFSKKLEEPEESADTPPLRSFRNNLMDGGKILAGVFLLFGAAIGIVQAASFFALTFGVPLVFIGLLVTGLGGALPEIYFAIAAARRGNPQLIMGNIMGSVIVPATLVLGIVALIHPIDVTGLDLLASSRVFLIVAAVLFFIFARTEQSVSRTEALVLAALYVLFVMWTIGTV